LPGAFFPDLKKRVNKLSFQVGFDPVTNSPVIAPSFMAADENMILKNLMELLEKFIRKKNFSKNR